MEDGCACGDVSRPEPESRNYRCEQQAGCYGERREPAARLFHGTHRGAVAGDVGEVGEVEGDVAGGLEALVRILFEAMADDAFERGRDGTVGLGQLGRILFEDGAHGFDGAVAVEGALAGEHFVEDGAETEDVGTVVGTILYE